MLRDSSRAGKSHWKHAVGARGRQESLLPAGIIPASSQGKEVARTAPYQQMWREAQGEVRLPTAPGERRGGDLEEGATGWYIWQSESSLAGGEDVRVKPAQGWRQASWISSLNPETEMLQSIICGAQGHGLVGNIISLTTLKPNPRKRLKKNHPEQCPCSPC